MFEELMKQSDTETRRITAKWMDRLSQRVCLQFFLKLAQREWRQNVWDVVVLRLIRQRHEADEAPWSNQL